MKNLWILTVAVGLSGMSCTSSNFTPSADTASRSTSTQATGTPPMPQSVPASAMVLEGRQLSDASFLIETASNSLMQISLGRTALVNATHPEVKKFAQTMVDHHSKALTEIKDISAEMNVTLSLTMLPLHQSVVDKLSKLSGSDFDEEYMEEMEAKHEQDVALYTVVTNGAQTVRVKAYAIRMLPLLRTHLFEADRIEDLVD